MILRTIALITTLLLLVGCTGEGDIENAQAKPAYSKQFRSGAATVILSISETNIAASGQLHFLLEVHAPPETEIVYPDMASLLESLSILDAYTEPVQTLPNRKKLHRRAWILAPTRSGASRIQPLAIGVGMDSLQTDEIRIEVESMLPPDLDSLAIRDIAPSFEKLPEQERKRRVWAIALLLCLGLPALFFLIKKTTAGKTAPPPCPHDSALAALGNLTEYPRVSSSCHAAIVKSFM